MMCTTMDLLICCVWYGHTDATSKVSRIQRNDSRKFLSELALQNGERCESSIGIMRFINFFSDMAVQTRLVDSLYEECLLCPVAALMITHKFWVGRKSTEVGT